MCAYTHSPDCQLTSCGRRELFSELSNSAEPRITHSNTSTVLQCTPARSTARIKDSGIPRGRIRNIDPEPRSAERSSTVRATDPVDSRLTTGKLNNPLAGFAEDFAKMFCRSRYPSYLRSFFANVETKFYKTQIIILQLSYFTCGKD